MDVDSPDGVVGMNKVHMGKPQQETGDQSEQSEMVPGADPVPHPTEAPARTVETEMTSDFQQFSLNNELTTFRPNEPIPTRSQVEEALSRAPQTQAQPPQRSESSSSAESDEQLQAALQTARSVSEKLTVYKTYTKELRKKNQKLEAENEDWEHTVQILTEQLKLTEGECKKLVALLDDARKEMTANEGSSKSQIETLGNKVSVLREALSYARRGQDIPSTIHLKLVSYELSESMYHKLHTYVQERVH